MCQSFHLKLIMESILRQQAIIVSSRNVRFGLGSLKHCDFTSEYHSRHGTGILAFINDMLYAVSDISVIITKGHIGGGLCVAQRI
jgi:hypothetical protein